MTVERLKEMFNEALEAGKEAQLMNNIVVNSGVRLDPWNMAKYNALRQSQQARVRKINEFVDKEYEL